LYLTYWFPGSRRTKVIALFMTAIAISNVIGAPVSGAIMQYMQISQSLGTDGQLAIKTDVLVDDLADKLGVPAAVRNSAAERAVLMEEARNQQQQQAIAQAMAMQSQAGAGMPGMPAPEGMPV
jgi:hypothetical protein